jgi:hypothetical protein
MAEVQLKQFMEDVLAITPRYGNLAADGIPGMGQAHPGARAVENLRQAAHAFAQAYLDRDTSDGEIESRAQALEAALHVTVTLSVTNSNVTDRLLEELDTLIAQHK